MSENPGAAIDLQLIRDALRSELLARGHEVASDTMSRGRDLYVIGENDLAKALFVFGVDAGDMAQAMYMSSGSWTQGMPPRFAVLPASEAENPEFEMIEQIRAVPLLFEVDGDHVCFTVLERLLAEHLAT